MERVTAAARHGPVSSSYIKTANKQREWEKTQCRSCEWMCLQCTWCQFILWAKALLSNTFNPLTPQLTLTSHGFEWKYFVSRVSVCLVSVVWFVWTYGDYSIATRFMPLNPLYVWTFNWEKPDIPNTKLYILTVTIKIKRFSPRMDWSTRNSSNIWNPSR